jgi:hypothetical protein
VPFPLRNGGFPDFPQHGDSSIKNLSFGSEQSI